MSLYETAKRLAQKQYVKSKLSSQNRREEKEAMRRQVAESRQQFKSSASEYNSNLSTKSQRQKNVQLAQDFLDPTAPLSLTQRVKGFGLASAEQATFGQMGLLGTVLQQKREGYGSFAQSGMQIIQQNVFGSMGTFGHLLNAHYTKFPYVPPNQKKVTAENIDIVIKEINEKIDNNKREEQKNLGDFQNAVMKKLEQDEKALKVYIDKADNDIISKIVNTESKIVELSKYMKSEISMVEKNIDMKIYRNEQSIGKVKQDISFIFSKLDKLDNITSEDSAGDGTEPFKKSNVLKFRLPKRKTGATKPEESSTMAGIFASLPKVTGKVAAATAGTILSGIALWYSLQNQKQSEAKPKQGADSKLNIDRFNIYATDEISFESAKSVMIKSKKITLDADELIIDINTGNIKKKADGFIQKMSYSPDGVSSDPLNSGSPITGGPEMSGGGSSGSLSGGGSGSLSEGGSGSLSGGGSGGGSSGLLQNPNVSTRQVDRSAFDKEMQDPRVREMFAGRLAKEVRGNGPEAQQAWAETIFNRAAARGETLEKHLSGNYYPKGQRDPIFSKDKKYLDIIDRVHKDGTNISDGATGNASGSVGFGKRGYQTKTFGIDGQIEKFGVEHADAVAGYKPKFREMPGQQGPVEGLDNISKNLQNDPRIEEKRTSGLFSGSKDPNNYKSPFNYHLTEQGMNEYGLKNMSKGEVSSQLQSVETKSGKKLNLNKTIVDDGKNFIDDLESRGYKIDDLGSYSYRANVNDPSKLSAHAGTAIDINPGRNPNKSNRTDLPEDVKYLSMLYGFAQIGDDKMHFERVSPENRKLYALRLLEMGKIGRDHPQIQKLLGQKILAEADIQKFPNFKKSNDVANSGKSNEMELREKYSKATGKPSVLNSMLGERETEGYKKWKESQNTMPPVAGVMVEKPTGINPDAIAPVPAPVTPPIPPAVVAEQAIKEPEKAQEEKPERVDPPRHNPEKQEARPESDSKGNESIEV